MCRSYFLISGRPHRLECRRSMGRIESSVANGYVNYRRWKARHWVSTFSFPGTGGGRSTFVSADPRRHAGRRWGRIGGEGVRALYARAVPKLRCPFYLFCRRRFDLGRALFRFLSMNVYSGRQVRISCASGIRTRLDTCHGLCVDKVSRADAVPSGGRGGRMFIAPQARLRRKSIGFLITFFMFQRK